jgi:sialate O-acetylesterase
MRYFFFIMALFLRADGEAAVKLPAIFSDHMVLQQKAKVQFWGWASAGEEVFVATSWQPKKIHTKADDSGKWKMELETPAAGGPYNIIINGENSIELKDVLIGEVWICAGQSNMTFPLQYSDSGKEEIARANYPAIRYFGVKRQYGTRAFEDYAGSVWKTTSSRTAGSFSAVAYYFARKVHRDLRVPVGIVCTAWSGTPAEAWTPEAVLQNDDSLHFYLQRWNEIPKKVGADSVKFQLMLANWEKSKSAPGRDAERKPDEPRTYYYYQRPWCEPGALFNGMINPVIPYSVKGILWYQGESNVSEADNYEHLFTALIRSWRQRWRNDGGQDQLPFYFVQIAPFDYSSLDAAARLREAQYNVMRKTDYTGMAVTIDLGNMNNIHFTHKKEVGYRLALIALAKSYDYKEVIYDGPTCMKLSKAGNKLELSFNQQLFTKNGQEPQGFEIGYRSRTIDSIIFVKARSVIKGNSAVVWNEGIADPVAVRYAWIEIADANLVNKAGLPAYPFQKEVPLTQSAEK